MPRYVILKHDWNGVHYDMMLEQGNVLKTWRLATELQQGIQEVTELADHRLAYLTYEGQVSGNRGSVQRIAEGNYATQSVTAQCWDIELRGILTEG